MEEEDAKKLIRETFKGKKADYYDPNYTQYLTELHLKNIIPRKSCPEALHHIIPRHLINELIIKAYVADKGKFQSLIEQYINKEPYKDIIGLVGLSNVGVLLKALIQMKMTNLVYGPEPNRRVSDPHKRFFGKSLKYKPKRMKIRAFKDLKLDWEIIFKQDQKFMQYIKQFLRSINLKKFLEMPQSQQINWKEVHGNKFKAST